MYPAYILNIPGSTNHLLLLMNRKIKFKTYGGVRTGGAKFTFDQLYRRGKTKK